MKTEFFVSLYIVIRNEKAIQLPEEEPGLRSLVTLTFVLDTISSRKTNCNSS